MENLHKVGPLLFRLYIYLGYLFPGLDLLPGSGIAAAAHSMHIE